ncbi:partial tRNA nuclease WapA, partial [Anaerolineae bacterium]
LTYQDGMTTVAAYNYTLDTVGNRTRVDELGGDYTTWGYDNQYRLTNETIHDGGSTISSSYTYDDVGNRTSQTVNGQATAYSYNALDQMTQAVTGGVTTTYAYDGRGNLATTTTGSDVTTYSWDALDRLTTVDMPVGADSAYTYDPNGYRVLQTLGSDTTNYLWDEFSAYGDVVRETNGTGTELANYTLANQQLIAQVRGGTANYYLQDGQGSTRALTNATGDITDTYNYLAYGQVYSQTGTTTNSYLYTGQQFDSATGLYDLRARYYDPGLGRFVSRDTYPINYRNPIELNRYGYVGNNPINHQDPLGLYIATDRALTETNVSMSIVRASTMLTHRIIQSRLVLAAIVMLLIWLIALIEFLYFIPPSIDTPPHTDPTPDPKPTPPPYTPPQNPPTGPQTPPGPIPGTATPPGPTTGPQTPPLPTPGTPPGEESDPTPEPEPEPDPDPTDPPQTDECDPTVDPDCARRRATTIVELGAGDYSNAIAMKAANSSAAVWATNLRSDWQMGKGFHQGGLSSSDYPIIKVYLGWQEAQVRGLQVGDTSSLENADVRPDHIGDLVYTIMPYPATAGQFGRDAARIASTKPGTTVAVTGGASGSANAFVQGFQAVRPGSVFVDVLGSPFGNPGIGWDNRSWEAGPYITKIHVVP